jgi:creatinine amidohydrolase
MEAHTFNGVMGKSCAATKEKGEAIAYVNSRKLVEILSDDVIWQMMV